MSDPHRLEILRARLAVWCENTGHRVDAAGCVDESTAAEILGRAPATLRNWRTAGEGPRFFRGARVMYALDDLAQHLESERT